MGRVEFEPGLHPITGFERNRIIRSWKDGVPHHAWNRAAAERVSQHKPLACAVDSMTNRFDSHMGVLDKLELMILMPEQPRFLNGNDKIYALAGDVLRSHPEPHGIGDVAIRGLNALIIVGAAGQAGAYIGNRLDINEQELDLVKARGKVSRRDFLTRLGMYSAGAALLAGELAATSKSVVLQELARGVEDTVEPLHFWDEASGSQSFIDGRTAMLIEKSIHASANYFDGRAVPLVIGASHSQNANLFLRDRDSRMEAISTFTQSLIYIEGEEAASSIINDISSYQIVEIQQLDEAKLIYDVLDAVNDSVRHVGVGLVDEINTMLKTTYS